MLESWEMLGSQETRERRKMLHSRTSCEKRHETVHGDTVLSHGMIHLESRKEWKGHEDIGETMSVAIRIVCAKTFGREHIQRGCDSRYDSRYDLRHDSPFDC